MSCGVDIVALAATGVYWIPLFEVNDGAGLEVQLVDARAVAGNRTIAMG